MGYQRRVKLALDTFQSYTSKIVTPKAPIQEPTSRISQIGSSIFTYNKSNKLSGFSSYSYIPQRLGLQVSPNRIRFNQIHSNPFLGGAKRYYYVDQYKVQHFRPRGPQRWFQIPRTVLVVVLMGFGVFITMYFENLETVPYMKWTHFVLLSKSMERRLGETQFEQMKAALKGKILPVIHPHSVRVRLIGSNYGDINRVSKTRFLGGHHVEKCQIRPNQNMKTESLRLDL